MCHVSRSPVTICMTTTSAFDVWLDRIDDAADAADLDRRRWRPRRSDIKDRLGHLVHDVANDAGQEYAEKIISIIEEGRTPREHQIRRVAKRIEENWTAPADDGGRYSLYRDDE